MNIKNFTICLVYLGLNFNNSFAQSIKDEDVEYSYIQLPLNDIRTQVKNYSCKITPLYEEKNRKLMAEYEIEKQKAQQEFDYKKANIPQLQKEAEEQYQRDMVQYAIDVKAAEDKFAKEMDEYKKKSLGDKIIEKQILGENNKPYKQMPPQPYRKGVSEPYLKNVPLPKLQTSYDYDALCNTHLKLYGFNKDAKDAILINVTLFGFDNTQPTVITKTQNTSTISNGKSSTYPVNYYSTEFSYRHPMSVQVIMPDGKEVMNVTPSELNNYTVFKSPSSTSYQGANSEMLVKTSEEKVLQENLGKISDMVNDMYGFKPIPRKAVLYFVKNKNQEYTDLLDAYNDASMGLKLIVQDETMANEKLTKALGLWKTAFAQSDLANNDARIDKDVALAIAFNMLEVNFATKNFTEGFATLDAMNKMELSKKETKRKEEFQNLFLELKKRNKN